MDFTKRLKKLTVTGALKKHNSSGLEIKCKAKSDGHLIEGSLKKGTLKYQGTWFGAKLTKEVNSHGVETGSIVKNQMIAG